MILEAAQKPVAGLDQFAALVGKLKPGEGLLLLVQHKDNTTFVVIKAAPRSNGEASGGEAPYLLINGDRKSGRRQ